MDSRAALQDFKTSFNAALVEIQQGLASFGRAMTAACGDGLVYSRNVVRTSYSLVGQHTFPIEEEIYHNDAGEPTPFKDYENKVGIGILFLPIVVPTVISSFTWIPLIGNSITSAVKGFAHVANLPRLDCTNKTVGYPSVLGINTGDDHRGVLRQIYGAPGYLLGAAIALPVAAVIAGGRFLSNTAKSFVYAWTAIVDGVTSDELDEDGYYKYKFGLHDKRHYAKRAIGGLGYVLGGVLGGISALAILIARGTFNLFYHSAISFGRTFAHLWNFATTTLRKDSEKDAYKIELLDDVRTRIKKYGFGGIGIALGAVIGGVTAALVFATRGIFNLFYHSGRSFGRMFAHLWNFSTMALRKDSERDNQKIELADEDRHWVRKYGFGGIGAVLGMAVGGVTAALVFATRGIFNLFYHSGRSFGRMFAHFWNFSTMALRKDSERDNQKIDLDDENRHWVKKFGFGGIGAVLGMAVGGVTAALVFATRGLFNFFYHSFISFGNTFATAWLSGWLLGAKREDGDVHLRDIFRIITDDDRHPIKRFAFGGVGYLVGAVVGAITAVGIFATRGVFNFFYHSGRSFGRMFAHLWNFSTMALRKDSEKDNQKIDLDDESRHWVKKFGFGGVGAILGLAAGGITAIGVFAVRGVFNLFYHSARSFGRTFARLWNIAASSAKNDDGQFKYQIALSDVDERHAVKKYGFGLLGYVPGFVVGGIVALLSLASRGMFNLFYHSARSFGRTFADLWNFSTSVFRKPDERDEHTIELEAETRNWVKRFGFGGVGAVLGLVTGGVAAAIVFAARGVFNLLYHSLRSLTSLSSVFYRFAATIGGKHYSKENVVERVAGDDRHPAKRFGFGLLGYIIAVPVGAVTAAITFAVRGIFNLLYHSARSFGRMFQVFWRFSTTVGLDGANLNDMVSSISGDERSLVKRAGFGAIGYMLGAAIGGIVALGVFAARGILNVLYHSVRSFGRMFAHVVNFSTSVLRKDSEKDNQKIELAKDSFHWLQTYGLGSVGAILGMAVGAVAAAVVFAARMIFNTLYHSLRSFVRMHKFIARFGLFIGARENSYITDPLTSDDRHLVKRFGFGAIGTVIGAVTGTIVASIALVLRGIGHTFKNSFLSFGAMFGSLFTFAAKVGRDNFDVRENFAALTSEGDGRNIGQRFFLGGIGYIVGAALGAAAALTAFAIRGVFNVLYHSIRSFGRIFAGMWNFATSDKVNEYGEYKYKIFFKADDNRHWVKRFGFGGIGYILGAVVGSIATLCVWAVRATFSFTKNTLMSFRALSGSLLNGAGHRHWFEGLGGDERPGDEKAFGMVGYAAAAIIVAPVATLIFIAKKVPMVLAAVLMVALSPLTAACKLIGRADRFTLFKAPQDTDAAINQKFKNLFSALSATGKFEAGKQIAANGSGKENVSTFFFKSVKLNLNSLTEGVLKELLNSYYKSARKDIFFASPEFYITAEFDAAIARVKSKYTVGALATKEDMEDDHKRIDNLAHFIRDYMTDANDVVPDNLYEIPDRMTWGQNFRHSFWGGKLPGANESSSDLGYDSQGLAHF